LLGSPSNGPDVPASCCSIPNLIGFFPDQPGGVFNHVHIITEWSSAGSVPRTIREKAASWNIHRHNIEPWWHEFTHTNFPELLSNTGFDVDLTLRNAKGIPPVIGIKPA